MDLDFELYKGKKYSSLLKDVVVNSEQKKDQIDILVSDLRSMIKTANDAIVVVPLIKDYLDVSVRNDEQLVKLAAVVQRIISSQSQGEDGNMGMLLSEDERKQLMGEVEKITKEINTPIEINAKK
jgi:CHASE3 domain sensor protein